MEIIVNGRDKLFKQIDMLPGLMSEVTQASAYELTETVLGNVVSRLQSEVKHGNSELAGSFKSEVETEKNVSVLGRVWSDKAGAMYREFGTGPNGQSSQKDLPEGINPVYTQEPWFFPVNSTDADLNALYGIPVIEIGDTKFYYTHGQPARPYMYPAFKDGIENRDEIIRENAKDILGRGLSSGS